MVNSFRLLLTILVIVIWLPQNSDENLLLRVLSETRFFSNYMEAETFLNRFNWVLIAVFLTFSFFAGFSYR